PGFRATGYGNSQNTSQPIRKWKRCPGRDLLQNELLRHRPLNTVQTTDLDYLRGRAIISQSCQTSTPIMHFMKANGLRYEFKTKHDRTGARMWVFKRDDELRGLLDEYDERKAQARREGRLSV